jgi:hypothetical protein
MPGSVIFDAAIGLVFVFLTSSLIASAAVEWVANKLNKRGEYLLRGLREMLDIPPATLEGAGADEPGPGSGRNGLSEGRETRQQLQHHARLGAEFRENLTSSPTSVVMTAPLADLVLAHPIIAALHRPGRPGRTRNGPLARMPVTGRAQRMHLASYVSARAFTRSLIDLLVPNGAGNTTVDELRVSVSKLPESLPAREALLTLLRDAGDSVDRFRGGLEHWYDEHMGRVSGWYKRWSQWRLLIAGAALALVMNVNTIAIGKALYEDEPVRTAVVAQSVSAGGCPDTSEAAQAACREAQTDMLRDLAVPIGWDLEKAATECRDYNDGHSCWPNVTRWVPFGWSVALDDGAGRAVLTLLGWILTAVAVSFGAPFWFDSLSKLGSLRTAGRRPGENAPYESAPRDDGEIPVPVPPEVVVQPARRSWAARAMGRRRSSGASETDAPTR